MHMHNWMNKNLFNGSYLSGMKLYFPPYIAGLVTMAIRRMIREKTVGINFGVLVFKPSTYLKAPWKAFQKGEGII